jgi:anti-sigma B factor antagonist
MPSPPASPAPCVSQPVLRASTSSLGTVQTVTVSGEMDISTVPQVSTLLDRAISVRPEILVLDLSGVDFCDSSGIHAVVKTHHRAESARISFRVIPPAGPARRVFEICSIDEFVSFVTVDDANSASAA